MPSLEMVWTKSAPITTRVNESDMITWLSTDTDTRTNEHCNAAVKCRGHEIVYAPKNTCLEPRCYDYVLYHTNEEKQTCEISPAAELALIALIVALVTSEFVTFLYRRRLLKHIRAEIPSL